MGEPSPRLGGSEKAKEKMTNKRKRRESWGRLRKLPSGRYQASFVLDGIPHNAPTTFQSVADAKAWLNFQHLEIERGTWKPKDEGNQLFENFSSKWLESKRGVRKTTFERYEQNLRLHILPKWGKWRLNSIKHIDVQTWLTSLKPSLARSVASPMKQIFADAVRNDILVKSPCLHLKLPKCAPYEPNIIDVEQFKALRSLCKGYELFIDFLFFMGVRLGEACALRPRHINGQGVTISESVTRAKGGFEFTPNKTNTVRPLTMPLSLSKAIHNHITQNQLENDDLIFTSPEGKTIEKSNFITRVFNPAVDELVSQGVLSERITPKDLRASCLTLIAGQFGIIEAARQGGHSKANTTTKYYARPIAGRDKAVANWFDDLIGDEIKEMKIAN